MLVAIVSAVLSPRPSRQPLVYSMSNFVQPVATRVDSQVNESLKPSLVSAQNLSGLETSIFFSLNRVLTLLAHLFVLRWLRCQTPVVDRIPFRLWSVLPTFREATVQKKTNFQRLS